MDLDVVLRLEERIDLLLRCKSEMEDERRRLLADREKFLAERKLFRQELDRILAKLECLAPESL